MAADVEERRAIGPVEGDDLRAAEFDGRLRPLLRPAFRLAQAMLRDRHEAEDAVQEAALRAWHGYDGFRDRGRGMQPWFLTIVANQCRNRLRGRWWRVWRSPQLDTGSVAGPEDGVVARSGLAEAVERLTPERRSLLYLRYELDLDPDEIARILGVRPGTVKSRLHRAVAQLRAALGEEAVDDGVR